MVLKILYALLPAVLPSKYYFHVVLAGTTLFAIYTYAQGRKTNRERDLHGRTILVTGAFTPIGLTLLDSLARRGAHIIALSSEPIDSGQPAVFIPLLRATANNENIYAEQCDLLSPASIRAFCTGFVKAEEQRLDAIIFAHEYAPIGSIYSFTRADVEKMRRAASCATFMLATLLLPVLLVAPVERDIRLITLINPFYAAAAPNFAVPPSTSGTPPPPAQSSLLATEGQRALRSAILMRHLQRVLDALPGGAQIPRTDANAPSIPVVGEKTQRSNIVTVTVSPGISRTDVVAPLFSADSSRGPVSWWGLILYILLNPLFRLLTKSPASAIEAVLHVLFLPTPFKYLATSPDEPSTQRSEEEILKPGSLYAECAIVHLRVPPAPAPPENDSGEESSGKGKAPTDDNAAGPKAKADDGELGGEVLGTMVWDDYERELKEWETAETEALREAQEREKAEVEKGRRDGSHTPPTVDTPS